MAPPKILIAMADYGHDPTGMIWLSTPCVEFHRCASSESFAMSNGGGVHACADILLEVAIPYKIFTEAGFDVHFTTEQGKSPRCDSKMLYGIVGALLGANREAKAAYHAMIASDSNVAGSIKKPH